MLLRNKKTGEIGEPRFAYSEIYVDTTNHMSHCYKTLLGLNADWEDYKPKESLIESEKIRKAVRAWAEANDIETVEYNEYWVSFRRDDKTISFKDEDSCLGFFGLENSRDYTIAELCGEE